MNNSPSFAFASPPFPFSIYGCDKLAASCAAAAAAAAAPRIRSQEGNIIVYNTHDSSAYSQL